MKVVNSLLLPYALLSDISRPNLVSLMFNFVLVARHSLLLSIFVAKVNDKEKPIPTVDPGAKTKVNHASIYSALFYYCLYL